MTPNEDYDRTLWRTRLRVSTLALGAMTFDDGCAASATAETFAIPDRYAESGGRLVDTTSDFNSGLCGGDAALRHRLPTWNNINGIANHAAPTNYAG